MKKSIKKLPESQVEIEFELSIEEFSSFIKESYDSFRQTIETDGFRKGKAPDFIVEEKIGKEEIINKAANNAIQDSFFKAIKEYNLEVIAKPEASILKIAEGNPLQFKIKAAVLPEVVLPDYKKIAGEIKQKEVDIEKEEVEHAVRWLQKSRAKFSLKNGPAEKGDFVEIEYFLVPGGESAKKEDAFILGEGGFSPGFEEEIIGMSAGGEKQGLKIKNKEGKDFFVDVKIKAVKKMEIPELNDEFARGLGSFNDLASLKASVERGMAEEKKIAEKQKTREEILEKISNSSNFEEPSILVEREQEAMLENLKKRIASELKISFNEYLKKAKKSEKELRESFHPLAGKKIRNNLILREIKKKENIEVSEKEIKEQIDKILKYYHDPKDIDISPEELRVYASEVAANEKVFEILEDCLKQ